MMHAKSTKSHLLAPFGVALCTMALFGALDMLRGVVAPTLRIVFHLSYTHLGLLFSASSLGYLIASFISGFLTDHLGIKSILRIGLFCMLVGILTVITAPGYPLLAFGYTLTGVASGTMEIGTNSLVPLIAKGAQARYFNLLHALYGVGASVSPLFAAFLLSRSPDWRWPYAALLAAFFAIFVPVLILRYPSDHARVSSEKREHKRDEGPLDSRGRVPLSRLLRSPILYVLLLAITLYVVAEVGVGAWLPTFLHVADHASTSEGAALLSGFYLTFTLGRFAGSLIIHRLGAVSSVVVTGLLASALMTLAVFGSSRMSPLFALTGIFFGLIFPTISALASEAFPDHTGTVLGFLFASAGIGSMVASGLIGFLTDLYNIRVGFSTVIVCLALTSLVMLGYRRLRRTSPPL